MTATWTAPRTWADDELVNAALLNQHLRDNLEYLYKYADVVVLEDVKTSGTAAQSLPNAAYTTRVLQTEQVDTGNLASFVVANQITLQPGKYLVRAVATFSFNSSSHWLRLRNITDGSDLLMGQNQAAPVGSVFLDGYFSIAAEKVLELQHYNNSGSAANGGTAQSVSGRSELYARIMFQRLGSA